MGKQLDILILESDAGESASLVEELRRRIVDPGTRRVVRPQDVSSAILDRPPDIILADYPQPCPGLFEVQEFLQRFHPRIPVIAITSRCDPGQLVELLECGTGHVHRQSLDDLDAVIHAALERPVPRNSPPAEDFILEPPVRESNPGGLRTSCASSASGVRRICERCGRIADAAGEWERINTYLRRHQRATVALGLCPACVKEMASERSEYSRRKD